jgi:hypothetical protein
MMARSTLRRFAAPRWCSPLIAGAIALGWPSPTGAWRQELNGVVSLSHDGAGHGARQLASPEVTCAFAVLATTAMAATRRPKLMRIIALPLFGARTFGGTDA